jgi:hypothetical protein
MAAWSLSKGPGPEDLLGFSLSAPLLVLKLGQQDVEIDIEIEIHLGEVDRGLDHEQLAELVLRIAHLNTRQRPYFPVPVREVKTRGTSMLKRAYRR